MKNRIILAVLLIAAVAGAGFSQNQKPTEPVVESKPAMRRVVFTPEQNRLVLSVQQQMKDAQTRLQAILDTIAATNGLATSTLDEIKPGEFELRETPPRSTEKTKDKPEGELK